MKRLVVRDKFFLCVVSTVVLTLWFLVQTVAAAEEKGVTEEILDILRSEDKISEKKYQELKEKAKKEREGEDSDFRVYWKEGIRLDSKDKQFKIKLGGRIQLDANVIDPDNKTRDTFSGFRGHGVEFRRARMYIQGTVYDAVDFKAEYDFADGDVDFNDVYIGLRKVPFIGHIKVGHVKEPFSLEELTSSKYITFMESSLPTEAFAPGRNTGIMLHNSVLENRMTWAAGGFLDTNDSGTSFSDRSDGNVTARLTGLPWYTDEGRKLIHLGFAYSHQFRSEKDPNTRFNSRPESHNTSTKLVDTTEFGADHVDLLNPEVALVYGPFSLQGEYYYADVDSTPAGDPKFQGFYVYASYFFTGEHRKYDTSNGYFDRVKPEHNFHPTKDGWGAWEVGVRYSYIDLNDENIKGGEEGNVTAGLNWYLNPNARVMLNYVRARVEDRDSGGETLDGNGDTNIYQMRVQIDF